MIGSLLLIFFILGLSITLLLVCLCAASCMGVLGFITPFLLKIISVFHDKPYTGEQDPINNECFICIEKIQNEVVATCNHSFCGTIVITQVNASLAISKPISIDQSTVQPAEKKFWYFLGGFRQRQTNKKILKEWLVSTTTNTHESPE
jgi:hypothetical protein